MIGDFGVPIAILIMVLVDYSIEDTYTQVSLSSWSGKEMPPGAGLQLFPSGPTPELPLTCVDPRPLLQHALGIHPALCPSGLPLHSSPALSPTLCPPEAERAQWRLRDSPREAGLGHQPPRGEQLLPRVDDGCQPATGYPGLHSDLHGDTDHHVSGPGPVGCSTDRTALFVEGLEPQQGQPLRGTE